MTASTITLMPDEMTLPSTRSARKRVRFHSANGTSTNPASVVSLNSRMVMNSWTARMKKASDHDHPGDQQHHDGQEIVEEAGEAEQLADLLEQRPAASNPVPASARAAEIVGGQCPAAAGQPEPARRS